MSSGTVGAISLGTLFASPGVVNIHADNLTGTGSLTANGGASIAVNNASPDYLIDVLRQAMAHAAPDTGVEREP